MLVYFHGGGWVIGDLDTHDGTVRAVAEGSGATVVSVDYRLAPETPFPAAIDDCLAAVRWVVDNAAELDVDPTRLAVGGDSAGGQPGRRAPPPSCATPRSTCAFQLLIYPVTDGTMSRPSIDANAEGYFLTKDTMDWFWEQYVGAGDRTGPRVSPVAPARRRPRRAAAGAVITAEYDPLRDEGEAYGARLVGAGRGGHDQPLRRRDPRVLLDARPGARGQGRGRPGVRGAAPRVRLTHAAPDPAPPSRPHAENEGLNVL